MARQRLRRALSAWVDTSAQADTPGTGVDWLRVLPFLGVHAMCLGVLWVGVSPAAVLVAIGLYLVRMFAITAFFHRYFGHRAFKTSRTAQFLFAALAATSAQRGPLWWASHHRAHHRNADTEEDAHSPDQKGFWWSHLGWFLSRENFAVRWRYVRDLERYPELRFLDRFDVLMPALLAGALLALGAALERFAPSLGTSGPQMLIWGFFISTVVLYHATFCINSLAHCFGSRRFETRDASRNNWALALLTLGEGWHNNHHHFPAAARQGFRWWEIDVTYYVLRIFAAVGLIWDLKAVPRQVLDGAEPGSGSLAAGRVSKEEVA